MYYYKFVFSKSREGIDSSFRNAFKIYNEDGVSLTYLNSNGLDMSNAVTGQDVSEWLFKSAFTCSSETLLNKIKFYTGPWVYNSTYMWGGSVSGIDVYISKVELDIDDDKWIQIGTLDFNVPNSSGDGTMRIDAGIYFIKDNYSNIYTVNDVGDLTIVNQDQINTFTIAKNKGTYDITELFKEKSVVINEEEKTFIPFNLIKQELGNKQFNILRYEFS